MTFLLDTRDDTSEHLYRRNTEELNPLDLACHGGHTRVCEILVEHGAEFSVPGERPVVDAYTQLHTSHLRNHRSMCEFLIEQRQHELLHRVTRFGGENALHRACGDGLLPLVDLLLRFDAREATMAVDINGKTPVRTRLHEVMRTQTH